MGCNQSTDTTQAPIEAISTTDQKISTGNVKLQVKEPSLSPSISREESYVDVDEDGNSSVGIRVSQITHSLRSNAAFSRRLVRNNAANQGGVQLLDVYAMDKGGKVLGKGATASVRLIYNKKTKKQYALKTIQMSKVLSKRKREAFRREVDLIRALDHPNIIKIVETFTDAHGDFHLVLPYCTGRELFDYLVSRSPARLPESEVWGFAKNMLGAINYLKKNHVVHRDIKLENYMFTSESENASLVLVDFGFSQSMTAKGKKIRKRAGTLYTMAPEVFNGVGASYPADVWAVGVVVFVLLFGQYPFGPGNSTRDEMILDIRENPPVFPDHKAIISEELRDLLMKIFDKNPDKRITAWQALKHRWLKQVPQATLAGHGRSSEGTRQQRRRSTSSPEEEDQRTHDEAVTIIHKMDHYRRFSVLKKMALLAIAQSSNAEKISELTDAFAQFDVKQDGTITWKELLSVLSKNGIVHNKEEEEEMHSIFNSVDQDHTGYIKYTEFVAASMAHRDYAEETTIFEAFQRLDLDRSGGITKNNLLVLLKEQLPAEVQDRNVKDVVNEIFENNDLDHDGVINLNEFREVVLKRNPSEMSDEE